MVDQDNSASAIKETPRGWLIVFAGAVGLAVGMSPIPFYTIGLLAPELSKAFGWSFGAVMSAIAFQSAINLAAVPLAGFAMDRFGARRIALGSLLLFGLAYMSFALSTGSIWLFYVQWTVMSAVGAGTLFGAWTRVITTWFDRRLGLAIGIASASSGVTGFLVKPFCAWLILHHGWRFTFVAIGLLPIVVGIPIVAIFLRERGEGVAKPDRPARVETQGLDLRQSVRRPQFWIMCAAFMLGSFALTAPTPNLENILRLKAFDLPTVARTTGYFGLAVIAGRIGCGWVLDRIWAPAFASVFFLLPAASCWLLAQPHITVGQASLAVIGLGAAAGFEFDLLGYLVARYFGRRHYGAVYGCFYALMALAGGMGPGVFGRAFDLTGSYGQVLIAAGACVTASGLLLLLMGPYPSWARPAAATPAS